MLTVLLGFVVAHGIMTYDAVKGNLNAVLTYYEGIPGDAYTKIEIGPNQCGRILISQDTGSGV